MQHENVWIRIAVNKKAIADGRPQRWRCFIDPSVETIELYRIEFQGEVNLKNFLTLSQSEPDERGVVGWFHVFGNININKQIASITLKPAVSPPPEVSKHILSHPQPVT